jgi:hypothetical protein
MTVAAAATGRSAGTAEKDITRSGSFVFVRRDGRATIVAAPEGAGLRGRGALGA